MDAPETPSPAGRRVIVVGGGFGGLQATKVLARKGLDVTLVDRNNYHLFQPLSYQVATGALAPGEIAVPLRHVFCRRKNGSACCSGEVCRIRSRARTVEVRDATGGPPMTLAYDGLVVAGGSDYSYFGHEEWRAIALEVKSLD